MKKFLSLLLCFVMVLGVTTVAFAGETLQDGEPVTEESTTEESTTEESTTEESTTEESTTEESTTEEPTTEEPTTEEITVVSGQIRNPDGSVFSWSLDLVTKILEIKGIGAMPEFTESAPWLAYDFATVVIAEGVTSVSTDAFLYALNLESIQLSSTVTRIESRAFYGCDSLSAIDLNKVKTVGDMAFYGCTSLKKVQIPQGVTSIGGYAFGYYLEGDIELSKIPDFSMSGKLNSVAGEYAAANNIPFEDLTPQSVELDYIYANRVCVTLFWNATEDAECYEIYRKTAKTNFVKIAEIPADGDLVYCDLTVKNGNKYTYSVGAVKDGYTSDLTSTEDILFKIIDTPKVTKAQFIKEGIYVEWKTVSDVDGYRLFRRTAKTDWTQIAEFKGQQSSYLDETVVSGETYYYTVKAYDGIDESGYDNKGMSAKYLSVPVLKKAQNVKGGVKVTWKKVKGADGYIIGRKDNDGGYKKIVQTGDVSSYTDKNVKAGVKYTYTVVPVSGTVAGFYNEKGVTTKYISAVTTLGAANVSNGVKVTWKSVSKCTGYMVYRKTADSKYKRIATVKGSSISSYIDKTAKNGVKYTYTVKAYNGSYYSAYDSAGKTVTFLKTVKISSVVSGKKGITLKWSKSSVCDGYYVYRQAGTGKWETVKKITSGSTVSYVDKTAKKGVKYTYKIKAYKGSYKSTYSSSVSIKDKY